MSVELAWKQNILVTDSYLLELLLVVFGFGSQAFVNSADKTFAVYLNKFDWLTPQGVYTPCSFFSFKLHNGNHATKG